MKFKTEEVKEGFELIHPLIRELCFQFDAWLKQHKEELTLTETMSNPDKDKKLGRVSASHSQGRAVDIRTIDIKKDVLNKFINHFNIKYQEFGAISLKSKRRTLMVYHDSGHGPHIHCHLGMDVVDKYKSKYKWEYPKHKKVKNETV